MKQTQRLTNGLIASAIALTMICTLAAQTAVDGTARVLSVKGPARYTTGNNVWQPLKAGAVVRPGTIVQTSTERGSYADLAFGDSGGSVATPTGVKYAPHIANSMNPSYQPSAAQNVIRIWENTALGIDKLSTMQTGAEQITDTQLDLKAGRVSGNIKKMSAASKYEIKLPNGVAGIRGTAYDITSDGVVKVTVGSVVLAWVNPKNGEVVTQVVTGGNQYDARTAQMGPLPPDYVAPLLVGPTGPVQDQITFAPDRTVINVSPVTGP
jgi:FecR protein